jgi:hypothetical protein
MPEVLHVYLPPHSFLGLINDGQTNFRAQDLRYQAKVKNPAVLKLTSAIVHELHEETSSGGLKMDALAVELIGALAQDHAEVPSSGPLSGQANFTRAFTRAMGLSPGRYRRAGR